MDQKIYRSIIQNPIPPVNANTRQKNSEPKTSFSHALSDAIKTDSSGISISKHAQLRLEQRNIKIEPAVWNQLAVRLAEAKGKGVKESLVLLKDAALIVNAKNNTVITAMDRKEVDSQIFTNINGAIILEQ